MNGFIFVNDFAAMQAQNIQPQMSIVQQQQQQNIQNRPGSNNQQPKSPSIGTQQTASTTQVNSINVLALTPGVHMACSSRGVTTS